MSGNSLDETTISSEMVFEGRFLKVRNDLVSLPNGANSYREYILHPGASVILAIDCTGYLIFERQYRHPLSKVFLELPAGKLDQGEPPLVAAQRELLEETGCQGEDWCYLGPIHPCIGYSNEVIHVFCTTVVGESSQNLDANEFLEVVKLTPREAIEKVWNGEISDAKTISVLFWLSHPEVQRRIRDIAQRL